MSKSQLGKHPAPTDRRDACHVAIAPVRCDNNQVNPGDRVIFVKGSSGRVYLSRENNFHAIVDPFLKRPVPSGQLFWVLIVPDTVENLRHEWDHPAFVKEPEQPVEEDDGWSCRGC